MQGSHSSKQSFAHRRFAAGSGAFAEEFGAFLIDARALDELALQRSQRATKQSGERFDRVLTKLGLVSEADLCAHLSKFLDIPVLEPRELPLEPVLADKIPEKFLRTAAILPLFVEHDRPALAVTDPLDLEAVDALAYSTGLDFELRLLSPSLFEKAWAELYGKKSQGFALVDDDAHTEAASEFDLQRLRDIANEAPVIRRVNQIIADAIEARASDIHVEPTPESVVVRIRIDGVLRTAETLPSGLQGGDHVSHKDHGAPGHRGTALAARRAHQDGDPRRGHRFPRIDDFRPRMAKASFCAFSTAPRRRSISTPWVSSRTPSTHCARRCAIPTGSCS